jgi:hypothetical protein
MAGHCLESLVEELTGLVDLHGASACLQLDKYLTELTDSNQIAHRYALRI